MKFRDMTIHAVSGIVAAAAMLSACGALAQPNLQVTTLTVDPTLVTSGGTAAVTMQARNTGSTDASDFNVAIYFSDDVVISESDTWIGVQHVAALDAGVSSPTYVINVTIPISAPPGTRYIGALADYGNVISEGNESDNTRAAPITVTARPDLQVTQLLVDPTSAFQGELISVSWDVKNAGTTSAGIFYTRLYFSSDNVISTDDTYLAYEFPANLATGASIGVQVAQVNIPPDAPPGTRYIGAIADYDGGINEGSELNNTRATPITIKAPTCHGTSASSPDVCGGNGVCVGQDLCQCQTGWANFDCTTPVCLDTCGENASCTAPDVCECNEGYDGDGFTCEAIDVVPEEQVPDNGPDAVDPADAADETIDDNGDPVDAQPPADFGPGDEGIDTSMPDTGADTAQREDILITTDTGANGDTVAVDASTDDDLESHDDGGCSQAGGTDAGALPSALLMILLVAGFMIRRRKTT